MQPRPSLADLQAAVEAYARARQAMLESLGLPASNRDPLAEFSEHLVRALVVGEFPESRVQRSYDVIAGKRKIQVKYLANPIGPWINEHAVRVNDEMDEASRERAIKDSLMGRIDGSREVRRRVQHDGPAIGRDHVDDHRKTGSAGTARRMTALVPSPGGLAPRGGTGRRRARCTAARDACRPLADRSGNAQTPPSRGAPVLGATLEPGEDPTGKPAEAPRRHRAAKPRVVLVIGTRPEAIKLGPVAWTLAARADDVATQVCATGQHGQLVDEVLELFRLQPEHRLEEAPPNASLAERTALILTGMAGILDKLRPDLVVIEGDTFSVLATALASFYARIPVAHVEAGLRTWNLRHPFPEEANRRIVSGIASHHLAPTQSARDRLAEEGVPASAIAVTGNPGLDALRLAIEGKLGASRLELAPSPEERLILVTAHRRESTPPELEAICGALATIAAAAPDVRIVLPVHPRPEVERTVRGRLSGIRNITLLGPVLYVDMMMLLTRAHLVLTDSGGLQEEAPAIGKPVLVLRETTERPEAVEAGAAILVGRDPDRIVDVTLALLSDHARYTAMAVPRPIYGDGHAAERIADYLVRAVQVGRRRQA
jgi:UDP-N-acetylglucosamine 2-epimerase (non-hydrolysing)